LLLNLLACELPLFPHHHLLLLLRLSISSTFLGCHLLLLLTTMATATAHDSPDCLVGNGGACAHRHACGECASEATTPTA
jgi:hypothetical protein